MKPEAMLEILNVAEKLKCQTRHSDTSSGRRESVAEHSWRLALMAMLCEDEFPEADINKVIRMCLIHDLGEAFTGDIPAFEKSELDRVKEDAAFDNWVSGFPDRQRLEFQELLQEMSEQKTAESRLYKALDKLEAVIQHNESDLATWLPLEYDLQFSYGQEQVQFSPYLRRLKEEIDQWTKDKIAQKTSMAEKKEK